VLERYHLYNTTDRFHVPGVIISDAKCSMNSNQGTAEVYSKGIRLHVLSKCVL